MSENKVDLRTLSDEHLRPHFEKWFNEYITFHLIMKRWIRKLGDDVNELGVPMSVVWVQLKAFNDMVDRTQIRTLPDDDKYLLERFSDFISKNMEENSIKIQQAIEMASQRMDEEEGVYVPNKGEPKDPFDIKYG